MEGMERMEAEKQAYAKVARRKWVERKAANTTDVAFEQSHEGRGARKATTCKRYIILILKPKTNVLPRLYDYLIT